MELLSTVHWVSAREGAANLDQVIEKTRAWSPRKQMFEQGQISIAWSILRKKGWISGTEGGTDTGN